MTRRARLTVAALLAAAPTLVGCKESAPAASAPAAPDWVLAAAPDGDRGVAEIKASAKEGDAVVLRGRIGGRMDPISPESSAFTVIDVVVPHCGQIPGDTCPTPWDYCCETPESITANSATVQVIDARGQAIAGSPMTHGFKALDEVVVVGTVAPGASQTVLVVRATGLYRVSD